MGWSSKNLVIHGIWNVQQPAFHIISCFNQSAFILWPAGMMRVVVKIVSLGHGRSLFFWVKDPVYTSILCIFDALQVFPAS